MSTNFPQMGQGGQNPWMFLLPYLMQMFGGGNPWAQTGMGQTMGGGLPGLTGQSIQPPPSPQAAPPGTSQMTTPPIGGQIPAPSPLPVNTALPQAPQVPAPASSPLGGGAMPGPTPPAPGTMPMGNDRAGAPEGGFGVDPGREHRGPDPW